ncbi:MAG: hypothetical protein AMXMBFR66_15680 [Pseudomonadota bacterium]|nr:TRAP transporter small permease [Rubrivivax sp.]
MTAFIERICRAIEWLLLTLLAAMVLLVFGNVVLRYAFNSGITLSEELSRWLFVWLTFLGAAVALQENAHLGTDVLVARLGRRGKLACLVLAQALMLYVTWLLFTGSLAQARINWDVEAPVSGASVAWFYGAGVVFAAFTAVVLLTHLARTLSGRLADHELVQIKESEDMLPAEFPPADDSTAPRR